MSVFSANGTQLDADFFVFDKDGLMFDSLSFWQELTNERCRSLKSVLTPEQNIAWAKVMGVDTHFTSDNEPCSTDVDPMGVLGLASATEERIVTAAFLSAELKLPWHRARELACSALDKADQCLDLSKAIKPMPGYVNLIRQLSAHGIPYAVATSDTFERTRDSMSLYGCWENTRFVITPRDVASGKPAPDMLYLASKKTQVPLNRIAMLGDSYVDVKMASAAGCIGIGVSTDQEMREKMAPFATVILSSLEEIHFS